MARWLALINVLDMLSDEADEADEADDSGCGWLAGWQSNQKSVEEER